MPNSASLSSSADDSGRRPSAGTGSPGGGCPAMISRLRPRPAGFLAHKACSETSRRATVRRMVASRISGQDLPDRAEVRNTWPSDAGCLSLAEWPEGETMTSDDFGSVPGDPANQPGPNPQWGPTGQPGPDPQYGQPGQQAYAPGPAGPGQYAQNPYGPQYGPPQYGPPSYQAAPYTSGAGWPARRTNTLAIVALCCGIGQFIAGPFAGIPAIILGAVSLNQIQRTGEDGRGMAIAGVVIGIVGVLLLVVVIVIIIGFAHSVGQFNGQINSG